MISFISFDQGRRNFLNINVYSNQLCVNVNFSCISKTISPIPTATARVPHHIPHYKIRKIQITHPDINSINDKKNLGLK